jgi:hypothetical protein
MDERKGLENGLIVVIAKSTSIWGREGTVEEWAPETPFGGGRGQ